MSQLSDSLRTSEDDWFRIIFKNELRAQFVFFVNRSMDLEARGQAPRDESEDVEAAEQGRVNSGLSSTAGRPDCHLSR